MPSRRIPLEDFFRKPEKTAVRLSPGGSRLAWLAPHGRRLNLFVRDLASGDERRVTDATERDIGGYLWGSDDRLVYVQDTGGDENWRLYAVGADGSDALDLTPFPGVQCRIVDELEEVDDEILFEMNRRDKEVFDVYRLNLRSGEMTSIARNPGSIHAWFTDHEGKLRAAQTTDGVNSSLLFREREEDEWKTVATYDFRESVAVELFTFDNRKLFVSSNVGRDRRAILELDPHTGAMGDPIYEHPQVDVDHLLVSKARRKITGVAFETDKRGYHFLDDERARIQGVIDARLPGRENTLVSHSRDESKYVVHSGSDRTRGSYWLLELGPAPAMRKLFDCSPWLKEEEMAPRKPISYRSRDGLTIHGYLTVPAGAEPGNLPLLVHPHGGPWARDRWGFDPLVQLFANRGVAVLQMNFRGSTGYGKTFWKASFGQWGLAMQDDITDGVKWAIGEGIADPRRIAIFGGSYGGYATLSGITKTPELYACAVSYVGVANLFTWLAAFPPYWRIYLDMVHEMVGHPDRDAQRLKDTSPLFQADRIRCPLLVIQGANDPRVKKEESDQIVAALEERGLPVEYLVKDNEGHGFLNEENQFEAFRAVEAFLDRHLGLTGACGLP